MQKSLVLVGILLIAGCGDDGINGTGGAGGSAGSGGGAGTGDCATPCTGGQICVGGACVCPAYRSLCGGVCIPTSSDPVNCGGCGIVCSGATACSAGTCATSCLPGLTICGNACVDMRTDNGNCGQCGRTCGPGLGCVNASCQPAATPGPTPPMCAGGGPPIGGVNGTCAGNMATTTFTFALCSCTDVTQGTKILTDAYDSNMGPYIPGGLGGGVGLNGRFLLDQTGDVWPSGYTVDLSGSLWSAGAPGLMSSSATITRQELHLGGPLDAQRFDVGYDAFVAGNVAGNPLAIRQVLHQPAGATVSGNVTFASRVTEPVTVNPPCACAATELIPVAAIVAAHATDNDNALVGLDAALLNQAGSPRRLDLPCGRYYLGGINATDHLAIVAHGRTALFIAGDVVAAQSLQLTLDPAGELDVFIAGDLRAPNGLDIGSPAYPALSRTYVGGSGTITVTNNTNIGGNLYAAYAPVVWSSPTEVYGAVYAGDFHGTSEVQIHYDRQVLNQSCPPGGGAPPGCTSCRDCQNQACIDGHCGACVTSADCCAPLLCIAGRCLPTIP